MSGDPRREFWERVCIGVLTAGHDDEDAGQIADAALAEWDKRWGSPKVPSNKQLPARDPDYHQ